MSDIVWIDVREADEFAGPHKDGAVNISFQVIAEQIAGLELSKDQDIRVYCRSGRRSEVAKGILNSLGYTHVINEGGLPEVLGIPID